MDWIVLGIDPTKDKKTITAAYRRRLRETNPEDKPEEFKRLRAAYEEAMALADKGEETENENSTPVGKWIGAVADLYRDFAARIKPEKWEPLFEAEICQGLDTRPAAEEALLKFLMEKYFLPKPVWQLIDRTFRFSERLGELKEAYPADFLENVILNGLRLDPALPFELFVPGENGEDCDRYIQLYFEGNQRSGEERAEILSKLRALSEKHPYGEVLGCRCDIEQGNRERGMAELRELARRYPEEAHIQLSLGAVCLEQGNKEEAEAISGKILTGDPENRLAQNIMARCLASKGNFDEAKELLFELIRSCDSDPILVNFYAEQLREWNGQLIPLLEAKVSENPEDWDSLIELAWCYIQNDRHEEAAETAERIQEEWADPYKYHNLMGKLYFNLQDCERALPHLRMTEELIREMIPDGTDETRKRMERLPEVLQIEGNCLLQLEEREQAREKFALALQLAPEDVDVLLLMAKIHYVTGDHEHAVEILERVNTLAPGRWHSNLMLALSLYRLNRDREALEAVNRALATQVRDLSLYLVQMQILLRNRAWKEVHAILDFLGESGVPEDPSLEFVQAQLTELEEGNVKEAFARYQKIARKVEAGEQILWGSELYYRMAYLMGDSMNMGKEEDRELLIAMLDKGLALYDQDPECLGYKAWILQRGGKIREAVELYKGILEKNKHSVIAKQGLMRLYQNNVSVCAKEALAWYEACASEGATPELCYFIALCKWHLGDMEGAQKYYLMELELDPDDPDAYDGLAYLCDARGEYETSLEYMDQAIAAMKRVDCPGAGFFEHKALILRRMGDFSGALAAVEEGAAHMEDSDRFRLKFDICCQFGDWNRAGALVKEWKKKLPGDSGWVKARGRLYLLRGKAFMASISMTFGGRNLSPAEVEDFQIQSQELIGGYDLTIKILKRRVKEHPTDDFVRLNLAAVLKWSGRNKDATKSAEKALRLIETTLSGNLTDETLFRCRKARALAILGRKEEAVEELKKARALPLCDHCPYGSCKDADIFEAEIEEWLGSRERAMALYQSGKEKWPDDTDFAAGLGRINRKGT